MEVQVFVIQEHGISFHLFVSLIFKKTMSYSFYWIDFSLPWVNLFLSILLSFLLLRVRLFYFFFRYFIVSL